MNEDEALRALSYPDAQLWCDADGWRIVRAGQPTIWVQAVVAQSLVQRLVQAGGAPISVQKWEVESD